MNNEKVIVNYEMKGKKLTLYRWKRVATNKPLCIINRRGFYKDPVLAPNGKSIPNVMERKEFIESINANRRKIKESVKPGQRYVELALKPDGVHFEEVSITNPNLAWFGILTEEDYSKIGKMYLKDGHILTEEEPKTESPKKD